MPNVTYDKERPGMWRNFNQAIDQFSRVLGYLSGFAILLIGVAQIFEIICRNIFDSSLAFVWETAGYFHLGAVFLGASFALRTGGHIRVTILKNHFPRAFEGVATSVGLCLSVFLSYSLVQLFIGYASSGRTSGTVNDIPLMYPAAFIAFGSLLLTLQLLLRLVQFIRNEPVEISWSSESQAN